MAVYIPCLNPDHPDDGGGLQVGIGAGTGSEGGISPGISISHTDSPFTLNIIPIPPFISFGINFRFWANLFGLGETRIDREKEQIQDILTKIFQYLNQAYNVPIRDGHALQFPSDGVQAQFRARPDIAALVPTLLVSAPVVTRDVFGVNTPSQGELERTVNQYLANAAINAWPVSATLDIWNGMVDAANPACSQDAQRWLKNPYITQSAAFGAVLLQYIPLDVLNDMAVQHAIGDPLLENLIGLWSNNPSLVRDIPQITDWPQRSLYVDGRWCTPPYFTPFGGCTPLLKRDHILPIINTVTIPRPVYPTFGTVAQPPPPPPPEPPPTPQPPTPTPTPQPGAPVPQPQPPTVPLPQDPPYPQQWIDYACFIQRLQAGNSPLSPEEFGFVLDGGHIGVLLMVAQNPQCSQPLYRAQPGDPVYPQPPGQPPPQPQDPTIPPRPQNPEDPPTQEEVDYAAHMSRLLWGNAPLRYEELQYLNERRNVLILQSLIDNPQCKAPLTRQKPEDPATPVSPDCPPAHPQPFPWGNQGRDPFDPQRPGHPQPEPGPGDEPCPPDCLATIEHWRQHFQECCDELHFNVNPRLDWLEDFREWVYTTFNVPHPPNLPTPVPPEFPTDENPPGIPPGETPPPEIHLPPITDCNDPFVVSLLACILPQLIPPIGTPSPLCAAVLQCIKDNCETVTATLAECQQPADTTTCDEGVAKWGKWAECWLNFNTANPDNLAFAGITPFTRDGVSASYQSVLSNDVNALWQARINRARDMTFQILSSSYTSVGTTPYDPLPRPSFIFEPVTSTPGFVPPVI